MNYKIDFENDKRVGIKLNDVYFFIEKKTCTLYRLKNSGKPTDVLIPRVFPSGHQIRYIYSSSADDIPWKGTMVEGIFNKITISDGIFIGSHAFQNARVKKVVWNDCSCISNYCFQNSKIEEIANIENVKEVHNYAFASCEIKEMTWPEHCDTVPEGCFVNSKHFSNITVPCVKRIEDHAFSCTNLTTLDWPSGCSEIPESCFEGSNLVEINNISGVTSIGKFAFASTNLRALDLSDTNISCLDTWALFRVPENCKITPPYYMCDRDYVIATKG